MQKTYSLVCLNMDDEKSPAPSQKPTKKPSFLSWGFRNNRQKAASTLCLPSATGAGKPPSSKLFLSPYTSTVSDSAMY